MATLVELEDALRNAAAAGNSAVATRFADEIIRMQQSEQVAPVSSDLPTDGVPTTAEIFGVDETIPERAEIAPIARTKDDKLVFTPSELMMSLMDAFTLPGRVLQGHKPTDKELFNFTSAFAGGAPKNTLSALKKVASGAADEAGTAAARQTVKAADDELSAARATAEPGDVGVLEEAARAARFQEQGIPATRGDIGQDFTQQATEQRLLSMATGEAGEPLRQLKLNQSEAFIAKANELVDSLGIPKNTGDSIKAALSGRKDLLRAEKNDLYKEVAELSPELTNAPIITDDIIASLPDAQTVRRLRTLSPNAVKAVDDLLVEFGVDTSEASVNAFIKSGGEVTPLTLGNFDDFRIALGQIDRSDQSGAVKVITGKVREALDQEAAFIDNAVRDSGEGIKDRVFTTGYCWQVDWS